MNNKQKQSLGDNTREQISIYST